MKVRVRVPATTANLGPGFDALGMALELHNFIETEERSGGLRIEVEGLGKDSLSRGDDNLIYTSMKRAFQAAGYTPRGIYLKTVNNIPPARGLGSSSAAVVGGLVAANALMGSPLSKDTLLDLAIEIEGHPDNVAPALLGGLVICANTEDGFKYINLRPYIPFKILVAIPEFEIKTSAAREVLPTAIPLKDVVFNISRSLLLIGALTAGRYDLVGYGVDDKIHQPYRSCLVPGFVDAVKSSKGAGAKAVFLSGSGPSVVAMVDGKESEVSSALKRAFEEKQIPCRVLYLKPDHRGAEVW